MSPSEGACRFYSAHWIPAIGPSRATIKQINRRIKGSEKFWLEGGAEAILQLRAAQLSQDDRWKRYWARPRKHRRAVGAGRLAQAA